MLPALITVSRRLQRNINTFLFNQGFCWWVLLSHENLKALLEDFPTAGSRSESWWQCWISIIFPRKQLSSEMNTLKTRGQSDHVVYVCLCVGTWCGSSARWHSCKERSSSGTTTEDPPSQRSLQWRIKWKKQRKETEEETGAAGVREEEEVCISLWTELKLNMNRFSQNTRMFLFTATNLREISVTNSIFLIVAHTHQS